MFSITLFFLKIRSRIGVCALYLVFFEKINSTRISRLNYILWIQDIVHAHDYVLGNRHRIRGIDM